MVGVPWVSFGRISLCEYTLACRLRASSFSLRLGHARGKTTLSCFFTLSRRFTTRSSRGMRTPSPVTSGAARKFFDQESPKKKNSTIRVRIVLWENLSHLTRFPQGTMGQGFELRTTSQASVAERFSSGVTKKRKTARSEFGLCCFW